MHYTSNIDAMPGGNVKSEDDMPQQQEQPSTYFVQDRSSTNERMRLAHQEAMLTAKIGGVLLEQDDPAKLRTVIDIGCGAGGWLIEVAKTYPQIEKLIGIDISQWMVDYANERALSEGVRDRVEYHVTSVFDLCSCCPGGYFDLVNQRFGWSYLRTMDWPRVLDSYRHITKPGGIIRLMEGNALDTSSSPALEQLCDLAVEVFYRAGHLFEPEKHSIINHLPAILRDNGIQDVQERDVLTRDVVVAVLLPECGRGFRSEQLQH
ncbi:MAG: hypothetical protein PVSMB2_37870 [Ktedonobacteraceae bacterium]